MPDTSKQGMAQAGPTSRLHSLCSLQPFRGLPHLHWHSATLDSLIQGPEVQCQAWSVRLID